MCMNYVLDVDVYYKRVVVTSLSSLFSPLLLSPPSTFLTPPLSPSFPPLSSLSPLSSSPSLLFSLLPSLLLSLLLSPRLSLTRIHMLPGVMVKELAISVNSNDDSYMPKNIAILVGNHEGKLKEVKTLSVPRLVKVSTPTQM